MVSEAKTIGAMLPACFVKITEMLSNTKLNVTKGVIKFKIT